MIRSDKRLTVKNDTRYYRGNWQDIKYTVKGRAWVTYRGTRLYLDNFLRSDRPIYDGVYGVSYFSAYLIELDARGEQARVTYCFY